MSDSWLLALMLLAFSSPAQAYVDPGSGAMLVQAILAMVVAAIFYLRNPGQLWRDLRDWWTRRRR